MCQKLCRSVQAVFSYRRKFSRHFLRHMVVPLIFSCSALTGILVLSILSTCANCKPFQSVPLFFFVLLLLFLVANSSYVVSPFPFGRICFVVLVTRKGGESSWSGPWHLGCTSEVLFSMCTATRTSSYSPVGPSVFFCVFSLGLCFVCSFVLFDLFVCPHSFMFPWAVESSPLQFLALV